MQLSFFAGAVALVLAACATQQSPAENPQAVVNQRIAVMKGFAGALAASGQFAQGKAKADTAKTKLAAARAGVERLENLFPPGTALGDRGVTTSRALSTIFANRSDFDAKRATLADALAVLDAAVTKNDAAATAKQIPTVKHACLACHSRYRTPDES